MKTECPYQKDKTKESCCRFPLGGYSTTTDEENPCDNCSIPEYGCKILKVDNHD